MLRYQDACPQALLTEAEGHSDPLLRVTSDGGTQAFTSKVKEGFCFILSQGLAGGIWQMLYFTVDYCMYYVASLDTYICRKP